MEAKELQIGDLVQNTCGHKGRVIGFRYYADMNANSLVITYNGNDTTWSDPKLIEPIPLTEDILKANEIEYQYGNPCWQCSFPHDIHIKKVGYTKGEIFMQIEFVHELQHALRLCGLTELADNFKIE